MPKVVFFHEVYSNIIQMTWSCGATWQTLAETLLSSLLVLFMSSYVSVSVDSSEMLNMAIFGQFHLICKKKCPISSSRFSSLSPDDGGDEL